MAVIVVAIPLANMRSTCGGSSLHIYWAYQLYNNKLEVVWQYCRPHPFSQTFLFLHTAPFVSHHFTKHSYVFRPHRLIKRVPQSLQHQLPFSFPFLTIEESQVESVELILRSSLNLLMNKYQNANCKCIFLFCLIAIQIE